jgi:hypothetical protein
MRRHHRGLAAAAPLAAALALGACGGSDKPGYCDDRGNLEQSIKDVGNVQAIKSGGVAELKFRLQAVENDARALVSSAKSDFPSETNAISASVSTLKTSVQQLPSKPSAQQLAVVAANGQTVVKSVQAFTTATKDKCS